MFRCQDLKERKKKDGKFNWLNEEKSEMIIGYGIPSNRRIPGRSGVDAQDTASALHVPITVSHMYVQHHACAMSPYTYIVPRIKVSNFHIEIILRIMI